jgi:hypothetical protein
LAMPSMALPFGNWLWRWANISSNEALPPIFGGSFEYLKNTHPKT